MRYTKVMDYMMAAVEDLVGVRGHNLLRSKIERINMKYLEPVLLRHDTQTREQGLIHVISKLNMKEAMDFVSAHGSMQTFQRQASQRRPSVAATVAATTANGTARPLETGDAAAERGRNVVNKWRRAVERLVASNIETSANDDTHKILKEHLFKKPKYYRGQYLTTKLQINESFPSKLVNLEETGPDILQSVVADGPPARPHISSSTRPKDRIYAQARQDPFPNTRFRKHRSRPDRRYKTSHDRTNTPEENPGGHDRKMSLQSESDVPYLSTGRLHDMYETPKGSVVSLPTVSTRYTSPEPVFATSSSSVISFRAAPPSLSYSEDHQYGNLTSVHSQSPLTSCATANLNRRAVREIIYENTANLARRSLSHELQSPRESSL